MFNFREKMNKNMGFGKYCLFYFESIQCSFLFVVRTRLDDGAWGAAAGTMRRSFLNVSRKAVRTTFCKVFRKAFRNAMFARRGLHPQSPRLLGLDLRRNMYIYIYTRIVGPPKVGHTKKSNTLIKIDV